ncbi:MAG TPA: ATP-binding protein [Lacipirellulaceae bacterium]
MTRLNSGPNFRDCLSVSEAAEFLGVSKATLRNWDRNGKLKPRRHPHNDYRIYLHEDLAAILRSADLSTASEDQFAPPVDWTAMGDSEHFVQFYESDEFLVESVSDFVSAALSGGDASIVIATTEHRNALQRTLVARGLDVAAAIEAGHYLVLDAAEALSRFMIDGAPDAKRFNDTIGEVISQLSNGGRGIHAFGEMVALLWEAGNRDAAARLEQLWNDLQKQQRFKLFCAYPIAGFDDESDAAQFRDICGCHSQVIPSESYSNSGSRDQRLREITLLQQKAQSLEAEIVHRQEIEELLCVRQRELSDFFENAIEGLHKVGPDGTILWANKAEYNLLGYTAEEYIGHSITEFHADAEVIADMLGKLQRGETLENHPARLRCKNGSIKHVLVNSNACFEDGEFAYSRCFTRDVTQQYLAESALREADRRKDEFLAMLAHELRNPLAPIRSCLELVRVGQSDESVAQDAWSVIDRQVRQLTRLVDDLLDVSRVTRGMIELRKERVELSALIQSALETSRPLIDAANHELTVSLPPEPIVLDADPTRIAQVFANLLNNSAKYTPPGGRIQIQARQVGPNVVVVVRDNGVGISREGRDCVFDMFRQVDRSLERSQGGLGIGLTVVRRLVELHDGTVTVQSDGPGAGSEFIVELPVASAHRVPKKISPASPQARLSKLRVLVVDDNRDAGQTLSQILQIKGHDVRLAHDGAEAIDAAAEFEPQLILMDVGMPEMNGYEATRRIRQMPFGSDITIVALTGWGQTEDRERSADAGCSGHLVKPVDFAALERLIADVAAATP